MTLALGIDGGASAAKWSLLRADGTFIDGVSLPVDGHIYRQTSRQRLIEVLLEIKEFAGSAPVSSIYAGLTGLGSESVIETREIFTSVFPNANIEVVLDIVLGFRSHFSFGEGIFLYAGTGSIAIHLDQNGNMYRAGGWGYLLGDEGGGYWIGIQAIRQLLTKIDTGEKFDEFDNEIVEILGGGSWDAIKTFVYSQDRSAIAAVAPKVIALAQSGNALAKRVIQQGAGHLGDLVLQLDQRLGGKKLPVVLGGGIANAGELLSREVSKRIGREVEIAHIDMARRAAHIALSL